MNREEFNRMHAELSSSTFLTDIWVDRVLKYKEIEVLQEISESLKSVAASLRGNP